MGLGQAQAAIGERVTQCVVRVVMVGLDLDDLAQHPLHLVDALELLGHHRLLVEQVGVAGEAFAGGHQHGMRIAPALDLAQHLALGQQLGACILGPPFRHLLHQRARFAELALPRQQHRAAGLDLECALRVVDLVQPGAGSLGVTALVSGLGQHQQGLGQAAIVATRGLVVVARLSVRARGRRAVDREEALQ